MTVTQACTKIAYLTKREARRALHTAQAARDSGVRTRRECRYYHCRAGRGTSRASLLAPAGIMRTTLRRKRDRNHQ